MNDEQCRINIHLFLRNAQVVSRPKNDDLAPEPRAFGACGSICIGPYLCIEDPICALAHWHNDLCQAADYDILDDIPCVVSGVIYSVASEILHEIGKEIQ